MTTLLLSHPASLDHLTPPGHPERPDRIRAVTADQIRNAAQKWLDKKRSVTGYLIKDAAPKREKKRS